MDDIPSVEYTGGYIESVADILDIVNRPDEYFPELLESDYSGAGPNPLGRDQQGQPRPYPHGIWFRGVSNHNWDLTPSVFRKASKDKNTSQFYNERDMFTDLRTRSSNIDLRGYENIELLGLMQHHKLPTRLMDWTESPLIALHFAAYPHYIDNQDKVRNNKGKLYEELKSEEDCAIYVLNAYRLNEISNLSLGKREAIFQEKDFDIYIRSIMAEHTHLGSVFARGLPDDKISKNHNMDKIGLRIQRLLEIIGGEDTLLTEREKLEAALKIAENTDLKTFYHRLRCPVALIPRRHHARMDVQLSCFTLHGGKYRFFDAHPDREPLPEKQKWLYLDSPISLDDLNRPSDIIKDMIGNLSVDNTIHFRPIFKKFRISKYAATRIMIELDRLGITESMIFPDLENQATFARRRWTTLGFERPIFSLPRLNKKSLKCNIIERQSELEKNYKKVLYQERDT